MKTIKKINKEKKKMFEKKRAMLDKLSNKPHLRTSKTKQYWLDIAESIKNIEKTGSIRAKLQYIYNLFEDKRAFKYQWIADANAVGMEQALEELEFKE